MNLIILKLEVKILDDYRHEIVGNRRTIDIHKDGVVNIDFDIDFNSRKIDNNSNCEIEIDNISINKSVRWLDNISINPIVSNYKRTSTSISENISIRVRAITKNRIYNCKRGANAININEQKEKIRIKV